MKVLIIGASGLVGSHLLFACQQRKWEVLGTYFQNFSEGLIPLSITNKVELQKLLEEYQPEIVFLPAFISNVDYCEQHPDETYRVNVIGCLNVIQICQTNKIKLVFYSSDYVFDGKSGPYQESDKAQPISVYGQQKLIVENYITELLTNYLILRITVIYGTEKQRKNFLIRLIKTLRNNQEIKVPKDQIGSPTLVNDIADASCDLIEANAQGLFHVSSEDIISRYDFACQCAKFCDLPINKIIPIETSKLEQLAKRPLNAGLISCRLKSNLNYKLKNVHQGLTYLSQNQQFSNLIS